MGMLVTIPNIEFVKGIPAALDQDNYFSVNKRNLIVFDDQMIDAGKDQRIVNLFYKKIPPSHPECHLYRTERIPSRKRQSQH